MLQPHLAICLATIHLNSPLATLTTRLILMMITTRCDADSGCYGYPQMG